ncbi:hypothetical protein ACIO6U_02725 [Streptomyces sp. NPDC087422]|uniref:hypothetical protein n=1 Tax=Streptomyces sp. NPDC087422 TaxID=3365786 RepID=UPI00382C489A
MTFRRDRSQDFADHQLTEALLAAAKADLPDDDEFTRVLRDGLETRTLPPGHNWPTTR